MAGKDKIAPGRPVVSLDFNYDGGGVGKGGQATLTVDGEKVASEHLPQTITYRMSLDETLDIGGGHRHANQRGLQGAVQVH